MELSIKEKILIGTIGTILIAAIGGSVWAFVSPKNNTEQTSSQVSEKEKPKEAVKDKEDSSSTASELEDTEISDSSSTTSDSSTTTTSGSSSAPSSTSSNTKLSQSQKATSATRPTQSQPKVASCNQAVKESYKNLYDSQINAEKADWSQRVNRWGNEASARGMAFSGYVQGKINDNKPAHDLRLVQIKATYQSNLANINC